jgi:hypothetical protein
MTIGCRVFFFISLASIGISHPFAADAIYRSAPLARLIPQIQYDVRPGFELREPDPPLHLPPLEPMPALFSTVKPINEFLIALQHGL